MIRQVLSPIGLIFGRMTNVKVRFADNPNDRGLIDFQFLGKLV
jgi:hypothetical protein